MGRAKKATASPGRLGDLSSSSSGSLEGAARGRNTTIVIPCYNEAARLDRGAFRAGANTLTGVRFVFVDDGSTDDTRSMLEALVAEDPARLEVLPQIGRAHV